MQQHHTSASVPGERRLVALDGLRGLMTAMVIVSHYFGELPHGVTATMFGWIAVDMFFVLSGFLIGKLILDKQQHTNFFTVFYVRRFCRIIPAYVVTVLVLDLLVHVIPHPWVDADVVFPLWSYLSFTQAWFMITTQTIGPHWLAPTWTLAVEEHFYLIVPSLIVFTPRRWLPSLLIGAIIVTIGLRASIYYGGVSNETAALVLLPTRADTLALGLLAALTMRNTRIPWGRIMPILRVMPVLAMLLATVLKLIGDDLFGVFAPLVMSLGCASFLLSIVHGAPEAQRFQSKRLQFIGNNGYCLYLTHLPVLGLMHGLILGSRPDLVTPPQWMVTLAALPVCLFIGWGMTKLIEEPLTEYGRNWRWSATMRPSSTAVSNASQPLPAG